MWSTIVGALLGKVAPKVADYYIEKQKLEQEIKLETLRGKREYEAAKTQRASESEGRDADWELESLRQSGYKDEWVLGILSIPMIMSFIPKTAPYVAVGFGVLGNTPDWYQWLILLIFPAVYGIRVWRRKM